MKTTGIDFAKTTGVAFAVALVLTFLVAWLLDLPTEPQQTKGIILVFLLCQAVVQIVAHGGKHLVKRAKGGPKGEEENEGN